MKRPDKLTAIQRVLLWLVLALLFHVGGYAINVLIFHNPNLSTGDCLARAAVLLAARWVVEGSG